jgi:hypothetical protein
MIGKYDYQTNYSVLEDVRQEVINALYSCYFNIPKYSKTYDAPNLETELKMSIQAFQSMTLKLLKIIRNKYNLPPEFKTHDVYKSDKYHFI